MRVRDFMTSMIITADADTLVSDAAKLMAAEEIGCLVVTQGDVLAGLVTRSDIIGATLMSRETYESLVLSDVMTSPVVTISPDADLGQTVSLMNQTDKRHIPVTEGNDVIGLVSAADILRVLAAVKLTADGIPDS